MSGLNPIGGVHIHIAGVDLIRNQHGEYMVLEDNLRCPSGVSYMLENRIVSNRIMPDLLSSYRVRSVTQYPQMLFDALAGRLQLSLFRTCISRFTDWCRIGSGAGPAG